MSYKDIRSAHKQVWDDVKKSIARQDTARIVVQRRPELHTPSARRRARVPRDEMIAMEVIWSLARHDLLCSEATQAVVKAAQEWAKSWPPEGLPSEDTDDETDVELYQAVQDLALAFDPPADEKLPDKALTPLASTAHAFPTSKN